MSKELDDEVTKMAQRTLELLADQGKLIEAGWLSLRIAAIPDDAPQVQVDSMREAFYAGAKHLFSSVLAILDNKSAPTQTDMLRMDGLARELNDFIKDYKRRHNVDYH